MWVGLAPVTQWEGRDSLAQVGGLRWGNVNFMKHSCKKVKSCFLNNLDGYYIPCVGFVLETA